MTTKEAFQVGVDHRIQYTNAGCGPEWSADIRAFETYLVDQARRLSVDLIAEEFCEQLVIGNNATMITAREAARRAGIGHLFLDPDQRERVEAGITTDDQREHEWLSRLNRANPIKPLLVLGNSHLPSFGQKLRSVGYHVTELSKDWGLNWMFRR